MMKTVLILGINGTFGRHVAEVLAAQGWKLKAMMRDIKKLPDQLGIVEVVEGDASSYADVRKAARGVTMLVYGVNPANYDWEVKASSWLDNSARVVEELGLTIIFPGNIYVFNPEDAMRIHETSKQQPITRKGEIRLHMEMRLEHASRRGAKVLILRMGDFIAAQPAQSWLPRILSVKEDMILLRSPSNVHLKHAWAYVPDAAKVVGLLVEKLDSLPAFNVFHFKGYEMSMRELAAWIEESTKKVVRIRKLPWFIMLLFYPFSTSIRGVFEMRYLWQHELLLDDKKLQNTIAEVPHTPIVKALADSGYITIK